MLGGGLMKDVDVEQKVVLEGFSISGCAESKTVGQSVCDVLLCILKSEKSNM